MKWTSGRAALSLLVLALWVAPAHADPVPTRSGRPAYETVSNAGTPLTKRQTLNFSGSGITCTDNAGSHRTDCVVSSSGVVLLTGDQTIAGVKTFSSVPVGDGMTSTATDHGIAFTHNVIDLGGTGGYETPVGFSIVHAQPILATGSDLSILVPSVAHPGQYARTWGVIHDGGGNPIMEFNDPSEHYTGAIKTRWGGGSTQMEMKALVKIVPEYDGADTTSMTPGVPYTGHHRGTVLGTNYWAEIGVPLMWRSVAAYIHDTGVADLTCTGSVTYNPMAHGSGATCTSSGNVSALTIAKPDDETGRTIEGFTVVLRLVSGNASHTWPSTITNVVLPTGMTPKPTTALNGVDVLRCTYYAGPQKYYCDVTPGDATTLAANQVQSATGSALTLLSRQSAQSVYPGSPGLVLATSSEFTGSTHPFVWRMNGKDLSYFETNDSAGMWVKYARPDTGAELGGWNWAPSALQFYHSNQQLVPYASTYSLGIAALPWGSVYSKTYRGTSNAQTTSGAVTIDPTTAGLQYLIASGNVSSITISTAGCDDDQQLTLLLQQNAGGTATWPSTVANARLPGGSITKTTTANAVDMLRCTYAGTTFAKWVCSYAANVN